MDVNNRITALAVYPNDTSLLKAAEEGAKILREKRGKASFTAKQKKHRRGRFAVLGAGITHGNGRLVRSYLSLRNPIR